MNFPLPRDIPLGEYQKKVLNTIFFESEPAAYIHQNWQEHPDRFFCVFVVKQYLKPNDDGGKVWEAGDFVKQSPMLMLAVSRAADEQADTTRLLQPWTSHFFKDPRHIHCQVRCGADHFFKTNFQKRHGCTLKVFGAE